MKKLFFDMFNSLPSIEYNSNWENGTGYFDNAVNEKIDQHYRFVDPSGRKGMLIKLRTYPSKNMVIFQRYTNDNTIFVANLPDELCNLRIFNAPLRTETLVIIQGIIENNSKGIAVSDITKAVLAYHDRYVYNTNVDLTTKVNEVINAIKEINIFINSQK